MAADPAGMEEIAGEIHTALQSPDLLGYRELLDPNVTWGAPDDSNPVAATVTKCLPGTAVVERTGSERSSQRRVCTATRSSSVLMCWTHVLPRNLTIRQSAGRS